MGCPGGWSLDIVRAYWRVCNVFVTYVVVSELPFDLEVGNDLVCKVQGFPSAQTDLGGSVQLAA